MLLFNLWRKEGKKKLLKMMGNGKKKNCELRFCGESLFGISMGILVKWLWLCSHVLRGQRGRDRECDKYSISLSERSNDSYNCCHAFSMTGVMVVYC